MSVFENRALRILFGSNREGVAEEWGTLYTSEEFHNYFVLLKKYD
jgi:hypothetical protein